MEEPELWKNTLGCHLGASGDNFSKGHHVQCSPIVTSRTSKCSRIHIRSGLLVFLWILKLLVQRKNPQFWIELYFFIPSQWKALLIPVRETGSSVFLPGLILQAQPCSFLVISDIGHACFTRLTRRHGHLCQALWLRVREEGCAQQANLEGGVRLLANG